MIPEDDKRAGADAQSRAASDGVRGFIGQLLAYDVHLMPVDMPAVVVAGLIAMLASIVPRLLSGPAERPAMTVLSAVNVPDRSKVSANSSWACRRRAARWSWSC